MNFPIRGQSPDTIGGTPLTLQIYTDDADKLYQQALDAGAKEAIPLKDVFWGDRYGQILDPFGFRWAIATHKYDVSHEEFEKTAREYFK
ncbi:VOC family protein [Nitrosopumilus sp.]|uniref:VOC family protein n=1 Tax=Nitrosopumilus sp. TaxID=2024843 RepID=UPI00292D3DF6|nr:VOC family protein [Nitrosopumilus sp.]